MLTRSLGLVVLMAAAVVVIPAPAPLAVTSQAEATPRKRYCSTRSAPRGCTPVPKGSRRSRRVRPQDEPAVAPPGYVNLGGVGLGDGDGVGAGNREEGALDWASGFTDSTVWSFRDERFVESAYEAQTEKGRFAAPRLLRRHLQLKKGSPTLAPPGTLMLFAADPINGRLGHVGLSLGDGRMLSALKTVRTTDVANVKYWREAYLGWSRAPRDWPGRLPLPFEITGQIAFGSASIVSPGPDVAVSGTVSLQATAPLAAGLEFAAYFAEDPVNGAPTWHSLGRASAIGGVHALAWDTTTVPNQDDAKIGTVTIAAITIGADGTRQDVADYRRVSVRNGA